MSSNTQDAYECVNDNKVYYHNSKVVTLELIARDNKADIQNVDHDYDSGDDKIDIMTMKSQIITKMIVTTP